ncbi:MAG TPA: ammonium transporter [Candidatus Dormibacteraeota bacterium]|nr:ammonium transporter [Candidatus Dormibacteraeota bacterium]
MDTGDTAWMLASAALVLFMTPGLALFYGGMTRQKNMLGTIMHSYFIIGLVSVHWAVIGYTLAFGTDVGGLIGGFDHLFLNGVGQGPSPFAKTIPDLLFVMYQGMFAVITPALISGAFAERMRFGPFVVFTLLWSTVVYAPIAHWVWGGGWLGAGHLGALDFAGGTVVHISSGMAALAAALVLGRRLGWPREPVLPHNLPFTVLGAGILWFGWFGFNAGSALASNGLAASAFAATHLAAAAATLAWALAEYLERGKASVLGAASGSVAGLVAITPAAGFVAPMPALIIGGVAGMLCYFAVSLKFRLGYDDSLDVVGVHGAGGTWGALATGLFASVAVNSGGADGLFYGNVGQFGIQAISVLVTIGYSFIVSIILFKVVDATMGLRTSEEEEVMGLDLSQHGERAYSL